MIEKILNKIEEYECICLYRHVNPDYDAFGSQFGVYDLIQKWLNINLMEKSMNRILKNQL